MPVTMQTAERTMTAKLSGELDHHHTQKLREEIDRSVLKERPGRLVLDFGGVEFMDSSGIAIVIACVRRMRQLRGEVLLRSVPPQPLKVLKASGIERIAKLEEERSLVHET